MKIEFPWSGPVDADEVRCSWEDVAVDPARVGCDPDAEEVSGCLNATLTDEGIIIDFYPEGGGNPLTMGCTLSEIMELLQ